MKKGSYTILLKIKQLGQLVNEQKKALTPDELIQLDFEQGSSQKGHSSLM